MKNTEIRKIENEILRHKELYYNGTPEISDEEFDSLEEKLRSIKPESPVLNLVGSPVKSSDKIQHETKMLSLDKCYDLDKFIKWKGDNDVVSTFKFDGSSCSLVYKKGVLTIAKTRGDGVFGENILNKVLYIPSIPNELNIEINCEIRGEIYCTSSDFLKLKSSMEKANLDVPQSQRNIVAGLLGRKEGHHLSKYLSFKAFELISSDIDQDSEVNKFKFLQKLGLETPEFYNNKTRKDVDKRINEARDFMESGDYLIDGLVFTYNDTSLHSKLGETSHHPRYKMAFKFQGDTKATKIINIEWGVSRNGTLTPVANVDPVELSQAMVGRVTLHNYGLVKAEKLKKGDLIEIVRSGEVIPKFLRVIKPSKEKVSFPTSCPSCKSKLVIDDIRLLCVNDFCPTKQLESILYYCSKMGIDDLSSKRLQEMISNGLVTDIPSIYDVTVEKMMELDKVKEKLATKIVNNIQSTKKTDLISFMTAMGLSGSGRQKCEKIAQSGFNTIDKFLSLSVNELIAIEGFAEKSAEDFFRSLKSKTKIIKKIIAKGVKISDVKNVDTSGALVGNKFCITGTLSQKRSDIQRMIKNAGGEIVSSVTSKTNYLVTNDTESSSSKFKKAVDLGIPIISEDKLFEMIG